MTKKLLTVTLNPAIDINYPIPDFEINRVQRVQTSFKSAGGKGINVARVASELGMDVTCTGIIGGAFGDWLTEDLERSHIHHRFLNVPTETRLCIAITNTQSQTEILESGNPLPDNTPKLFSEHFEKLVSHFDIVAISGSLPPSFPIDYYVQLLQIAHRQGIPVCLDTSGDALAYTVAHTTSCPPLLIKPNEEEITALTKDAQRNMVDALRDPALAHIPHVLMSQGKHGALLRTNHDLYRYDLPKIEAVNPVGSGDSAVAGFCYGLSEGLEITHAVIHSMAAGMANAMELRTGHLDIDRFRNFLTQIKYVKVV